jgi:hypothetical protein
VKLLSIHLSIPSVMVSKKIIQTLMEFTFYLWQVYNKVAPFCDSNLQFHWCSVW